ncbi:MAG: hypothetical protein ACYS7M_00070 [Planctomycetota bacterium]|jgi:hypothetical protein
MDADQLPDDTHVIYAGDFNFYHNAELGYLHFLSPGSGQAVDPLGSELWAGQSNAAKHTQSPRCVQSCGLVAGCLDDRFDFQLVTEEWLDGRGFELIPGTYRAFGNDGMHFDMAINEGNNFYYSDDVTRSNALASALHDASDHLPVVADYQFLPAVEAFIDSGDGVGNPEPLDLLAGRAKALDISCAVLRKEITNND